MQSFATRVKRHNPAKTNYKNAPPQGDTMTEQTLPQQNTGLIKVLTCMMFSAINFPSVGLWVWLGAKLEYYLQQNTARRVFNWTMALLLVVSMIPVLWV